MNKYCVYHTHTKNLNFRKIKQYKNLIELLDYQLTPGLFFEGEIYKARIVRAEDPDLNFNILNGFLDENDIIFEAEDDDSALLIMEVDCE